MQNAEFSSLRGLGTDAVSLSFVEKNRAVKAILIDTDALIKMVTQGSLCDTVALVAKLKAVRLLGRRRSKGNSGNGKRG